LFTAVQLFMHAVIIAYLNIDLKHEIMIRLEAYKGHMMFMIIYFTHQFCISINIVYHTRNQFVHQSRGTTFIADILVYAYKLSLYTM
jgi:hypothetical protein